MKALAERECKACKGMDQALEPDRIQTLKSELGHDWSVVGNHHLEKEFEFEDFRQALDFTNQVGELAEEVGHHPDIYLAWGKVKIILWTHSAEGLTESDFIMAARIQRLWDDRPAPRTPLE